MASVESAVHYLKTDVNKVISSTIALNEKLRNHLKSITNVKIDELEDTLKDPLKTIFRINSLTG